MATITVYTGPTCPQCSATKRALEKSGLAYIETPIGEKYRERFQAAGHRSLPVVVVTDDAGEQQAEWSGFRPDMIKGLVP